MKMNHIYISLLVAFALSVFSSCSNDDSDNPGGKTGSGDEQVTLHISVSEPSKNRAVTENGDDALNENKIKTLDVFIYPLGQDNCAFYQRITPATEITGTGSYEVPLGITQEAFTYNLSYYTYVVANYDGNIPQGGITLTALKALTVSDLNPDAVQSHFLMDGVSSSLVLNDLVIVNKVIPVSLKRAAAKIRIGMVYGNNYTLSPANPVSKRLVQYAVNSSVLDTSSFVTPTLETMPGFTNITAGANSNGKIVLYSYTNDWNKNKNKETYVIVNVPVVDSNNQTHAQNYYKVPVNYLLPSDIDSSDPVETSQLYKLHRNYLYDITLMVDKLGSTTPENAVRLSANYIIQDWTTKEVLVAVEGLNYLYVENTSITLPNSTTFTTSFQSSSNIQVSNVKVNDTPVANGTGGINITWDENVTSGNIVINSALPTNFFEKNVTFDVVNESGLKQSVTVRQFPPLFLSSDVSLETPTAGDGQDNKAMFIVTSLVADFSSLNNPDEFDEAYPPEYTHYAADPELGASYADYIRNTSVLGYPRRDSEDATIDTDENNRRISPRFMLASQFGATPSISYSAARDKCINYVERDSTTNETYSDWRMPTLAETYLIDIFQNTRASEVKRILEGHWYWSARQSSAVMFMDPRVGNTPQFNIYSAAVRCVRDVKN